MVCRSLEEPKLINKPVAATKSFTDSPGVRVMIVQHVLHPTKKIDDETDEKYRSKTYIHINLQWMVRAPIET